MLFSPETTKPMREFVEVLLRGPQSTLTPAEREMIATFVSSENDCYYCQHSHGAAAAEHLGGDYGLIEQIKRDYAAAPVSDKLKALFGIAKKVQIGGKQVTPADVEAARGKRRHRPRYSRRCADRGGLLHVQPLCGWARDVGADRFGAVSRKRQAHRERGLYPFDRPKIEG
jgi:AhpD family alkylhydroperoxidase